MKSQRSEILQDGVRYRGVCYDALVIKAVASFSIEPSLYTNVVPTTVISGST